jgi:two-component system sensor histidine kinase TctE
MSVARKSSIRKQLIGWLMIPIVSLCLVSAVGTYIIAIRITTQAYDAALIESARELANRLSIEGGKVTLDLPPAALAVFKEDNIDKFYYAALGSDGHLIAGDWDIMQSIKKWHSDQPRFLDGKIDHHPVRIARLIVPLPMPAPLQGKVKVSLFVAETILKRQALTNEILVAVVLPQLVLIALASLAVWFGVARGLAPLKAVQAAIARRTQWDLTPVEEVDAPVEIHPLVDAIDDLLSRLNKDIELQRRFVANAAHQLRTPLAGLKTQTELALRQQEISALQEVLKQIHRSIGNVTRLVNQLLSLAQIEPSGAQAVVHTELDLNSVVRDATKDLVPYALSNKIDLGFEGALRPLTIEGDSWAIREMVTNLIDNAIRYTQPGGKVTVKVDANEFVELSVEDDGPGIPETERERVFERFYRVLGNRVGGSGLGLAIVKEIAQSHRAKVTIDTAGNGKGTLALVIFPPAKISFEPPVERKPVAPAVRLSNSTSSVKYK